MTETAIKERGILFTGHMVRAILDGNKTQTRRVIKPQPDHFHRDIIGKPKPWSLDDWNRLMPQNGDLAIRCRHGKPGDKLCVRESFRKLWPEDGPDPVIRYRADNATSSHIGGLRVDEETRWRSPYHMPRWACRLILEITDVRVERVQDISKDDALAEGVWPGEHDPVTFDRIYSVCMPIHLFGGLWDSINAAPKPVYARGEDGKKFVVSYISYPWEEGTLVQEHRGKPHHVYGNPWVWPISFKRSEPK